MYIKNILGESEKILLKIKYTRILYCKLFFTKISEWFRKLFDEMVCTNKRIILKTGIIKVQTQEILLKQIETVSIEQDGWGRFFGYGRLQFTGTGNSSMTLDYVRNIQSVKRQIDEILHYEQKLVNPVKTDSVPME